MTNLYHIGRVAEVVIRMPSGEELTIHTARVEVEIETETLDHFSLSGGAPIADMQVTISEDRVVKLKTEDYSIIEELTRLIRED